MDKRISIINLIGIQMFLKIKIEEEQFKASVGMGLNDWVWLAHYASRMYSKTIYPQGTYLPTILYLENVHNTQIRYHPYPRQKIFKYLQAFQINPEQYFFMVKIRKANHQYTEDQKNWQKQAYEKDQHLITFKFNYSTSSFSKKKDFHLKVKTHYIMADQMKHLFTEKQYPTEIKTKLTQKQQQFINDLRIGPNQLGFQGVLKVPQGVASHKLFYYQRDSPHDEYTEIELSQKKIKREDFKIKTEPLYVSHYQIQSLIQNHMKIEDTINKTLQQKQLQTKKRNASSSLCCYTFEQLWQIIVKFYSEEVCLQEYQKSTIERIKLGIQKCMNQLYQIFFYYFVIQNQQKDKKQQLGINYQHAMHFLRDYGILTDLTNLSNFFEFYNVDEGRYKTVQDTLDVKDHLIKFPQFIVILLRSIQFVQTSTFLMKGETFDSAATKIFDRIVDIDSDLIQFTSFRRNLRQNPKIISFIRTNSQKLKQIFTWLCQKSIQSSSSTMIIMKEQIKQLLISFHLVDSGIDKVVNECFKQLRLNQEGIFYYEFLIVVEWLSMATVADQKDQDFDNEEEEVLMIVEKMKYFLNKINVE